jgi:hypothetical protein
MAGVETAADSLAVDIEGADRIWTLRSRLEVPLDHVAGVSRRIERPGCGRGSGPLARTCRG